MVNITLKNFPDELHARLRESARRHHRSLNKEVVALLDAQLRRERPDAAQRLREVDALREALPAVDHELIDRFKRTGRA